MRPIIDESEWLFAIVKGATLVLTYWLLTKHSKTHLDFIKRACQTGCAAYLLLWITWFVSGSK